MEWVAKRNLLSGLALLGAGALAIALYQFFPAKESAPHVERVELTSCFNVTTEIVITREVSQCREDEFILGSGKLTSESGTSTSKVNDLLLNRFSAAEIVAATEGVNLYISSGFRSRERQAILFAREVAIRGSETEAAKWVLPPQYSHHPLGLALDINYPGDPQGALWLEKNGWRFGLCRVYANEWWHFEGASDPGRACPAMAPNALVDLP